MQIPARYFRLASALAAIVVMTGCPFDEPTDPQLVSKVVVDPETMTVGVGATKPLDVSIEDQEGADVNVPVTWTSDNPAVASISAGTGTRVYVTGVSAGTTQVRATAAGKTDYASITVTNVIGTADGILYSSTQNGNAEIYLLESSGPRNLTSHAATDLSPTKHGDRIYFSSNRSGNFEIYSMKLDGTDIIRLTNNTVSDHSPSVSVNGVVAFARDVGAGREQIFTMGLLGQNQTNISNNSFHESDPDWRPDGAKLVFISDRDAKFGPGQYMEIYSMNASGGGVARLTNNDGGIDYYPSWSPDGSKIAFTTNRGANPTNPEDPTCYNQALEVWVMNADGSGLTNLTNHCRGDAAPAWSPNGAEIVFLSDRGGATNYAWDLWKIPSTGGTPTRLTSTGKEASPSWR